MDPCALHQPICASEGAVVFTVPVHLGCCSVCQTLQELCKCPLMRGVQAFGKMRPSGMSVDEGANVQDFPGWSVLPAVSREKCT